MPTHTRFAYPYIFLCRQAASAVTNKQDKEMIESLHAEADELRRELKDQVRRLAGSLR
jgi:transcription initiation factor IIE alpha subunit